MIDFKPALCLALGFGVLAAGCHNAPLVADIPMGPSYIPANFHQLAPSFGSRVKKVLLLPLKAGNAQDNMREGVEVLESVMVSEVMKSGRFEVVAGDRERLNQMLRMPTLSADEKLPQDFLKKVRDEFGCDAVMFSMLTQYRPYPPIAMGWKLRLVDAVDGQTWWTADEVFDATDDRVAVGARKFQQQNMKYNGAIPVLQDTFTVLLVPRQFGMYSVHAVVETMPVR